jgi:hypothetical protein
VVVLNRAQVGEEPLMVIGTISHSQIFMLNLKFVKCIASGGHVPLIKKRSLFTSFTGKSNSLL